MKKIMFALMAVTCCSLMAQVLVYDYAASFKRIDVTSPVKVKYDKVTYKMDSPKVVSDKFGGFMVINACKQCSGEMVDSAEGGDTNPGNFAVVYIARKGSSKVASPFKNAVYRAIGRFYVAMFGAKTGLHKSSDTFVNPTKFTDAAGLLSFHINANGIAGVMPGFLGVGQTSTGIEENNWWETPVHPLELAMDYDTVDNAGFGKVVALRQIVTFDCDLDEVNICWALKNLSGSMMGGFKYTGHCSELLYDICEQNVTYLAPIAGTFTLKLNNKLSFTKKEFNFADFEEADLAIVSGLKKGVGLFDDEAERIQFEDETGYDLIDATQWNPIGGSDDDDDDDADDDDEI